MIKGFLAKNITQTEVVTLAEQACKDIAGPFASMVSVMNNDNTLVFTHIAPLIPVEY